MVAPGEAGPVVRFSVDLGWHGLIAFRRDKGCSRAAVLALCRAIVGQRSLVHDVTPPAVDEEAEAADEDDPEWDERPIRFTVCQRGGGVIEVERECGCEPWDVLDLCDALLDEAYLDDLDDTDYYRRVRLAG